jgi:hypothetical protein
MPWRCRAQHAVDVEQQHRSPAEGSARLVMKSGRHDANEMPQSGPTQNHSYLLLGSWSARVGGLAAPACKAGSWPARCSSSRRCRSPHGNGPPHGAAHAGEVGLPSDTFDADDLLQPSPAWHHRRIAPALEVQPNRIYTKGNRSVHMNTVVTTPSANQIALICTLTCVAKLIVQPRTTADQERSLLLSAITLRDHLGYIQAVPGGRQRADAIDRQHCQRSSP